MQITEPTLFSALQQGSLSFAYGVSPALFGLFALLIVAAVWLSYHRTTRPLSAGWKAWFIGLRSAVLILILFCLLRPVVNIQQVSPQDTYLAVLLDNSQSMRITDADGRSRREAMAAEFLDGPVMEELAESFQLRTFAFDQNTRRVAPEGGADESVGELGESGTGSAIGQALETVADQLDGLPLGGLVLVSDGADNSNVDPLIAAQEFGNRQIPVFTVGVGQEDIPLDIGIVDVSAARTVLEGSVFTVSASLRHQGFAGQEVEVAVMDGESSVSSDVVTLGAEGVSQRVSLEVEPGRAERIVYNLRVEVQPGEIIAQNNNYSFLVDNTDKPPSTSSISKAIRATSTSSSAAPSKTTNLCAWRPICRPAPRNSIARASNRPPNSPRAFPAARICCTNTRRSSSAISRRNSSTTTSCG